MIDRKVGEHYNVEFNDIQFIKDELEEVEFDNCSFKNCDFNGTTFKHCKFIDCHFFQCNLSNVKVGYSRFNEVFFDHCKMLGIDWTRATWPNLALASPLKFSHCILNDSSFHGLKLTELQLESCKLQDVDFREGNFSQGNFSNSDFSYSLFNRTQLVETDFTDACNYNIDIHLNNIKQGKFSRDQAINLLIGLDIELVD
jgi:fluoroquinolone resistance protein